MSLGFTLNATSNWCLGARILFLQKLVLYHLRNVICTFNICTDLNQKSLRMYNFYYVLYFPLTIIKHWIWTIFCWYIDTALYSSTAEKIIATNNVFFESLKKLFFRKHSLWRPLFFNIRERSIIIWWGGWSFTARCAKNNRDPPPALDVVQKYCRPTHKSAQKNHDTPPSSF